MKTIIYNSDTSLVNPDIELFLLPLLHSEPIPPKILFLIASTPYISQKLHQAFFCQNNPSKLPILNSGLTLSRVLINTTPILLIETVGDWNYLSELIGLSISHLILLAFEYDDFEDLEIEKLYDSIIRLETSSNGISNTITAKGLIIYIANPPEEMNSELLEHKIREGLKLKWSLFPKTNYWNQFEGVFSIEIRRFRMDNPKEYIPMGLMTKTHQDDFKMDELYCIGGIYEELLRLANLGQEYLYFRDIRSRCFILQSQRTYNSLMKEFHLELSHCNKIFDNLIVFSNEIIDKYMSKFDFRTQGIRYCLNGEKEVVITREKLKENINKELFSLSYSQKTAILASAERIFEKEINKIYRKFKELKQVSLLYDIKISLLEKIETSLQKTDLESLKSPLLDNPSIVSPIETVFKKYDIIISNLVEKERKDLLKNYSELMNKSLLQLVEKALSGEELLMGRSFWECLRRKIQQLQEKNFTLLRRSFQSLELPETTILSDIERLSNSQKSFIELELEKRKYRLEEFMIKVFQMKIERRVIESLNRTKMFEKIDIMKREGLIREVKAFGQGMRERMEESLKSMRYMELFDGKLWLTAEEVNLILQVLEQAFDKEIHGVENKVKSLEKKVFLRRLGALGILAVILMAVCLFVKGAYFFKVPLVLVCAGVGCHFTRAWPIERRKNYLKY